MWIILTVCVRGLIHKEICGRSNIKKYSDCLLKEFDLYLHSNVMNFDFQTINLKLNATCHGRDEKGLLLTQKNSVFEVDRRKVPDGRRRPSFTIFKCFWLHFYHTIGHEKSSRRQPLHFSRLTSTIWLFSIRSTFINAWRRPFYSLFHNAPCHRNIFHSPSNFLHKIM